MTDNARDHESIRVQVKALIEQWEKEYESIKGGREDQPSTESREASGSETDEDNERKKPAALGNP